MNISPLRIEFLATDSGGVAWYRLLQPLVAIYPMDGGGMTITVPAGFETDFASVPRWLWGLLPHDGPYAPAAVIHDWLYSMASLGCSRFLADAIFRELMYQLKVPLWQRVLMYYAVRCWGRHSYKKRGMQGQVALAYFSKVLLFQEKGV
jgi:hypothetical protein